MLENELVILGNVSGIVQGQKYEGLCKINKKPLKDYRKSPIYQFLEILFTGIKNWQGVLYLK
jgi:hypothetical protein